MQNGLRLCVIWILSNVAGSTPNAPIKSTGNVRTCCERCTPVVPYIKTCNRVGFRPSCVETNVDDVSTCQCMYVRDHRSQIEVLMPDCTATTKRVTLPSPKAAALTKCRSATGSDESCAISPPRNMTSLHGVALIYQDCMQNYPETGLRMRTVHERCAGYMKKLLGVAPSTERSHVDTMLSSCAPIFDAEAYSDTLASKLVADCAGIAQPAIGSPNNKTKTRTFAICPDRYCDNSLNGQNTCGLCLKHTITSECPVRPSILPKCQMGLRPGASCLHSEECGTKLKTASCLDGFDGRWYDVYTVDPCRRGELALGPSMVSANPVARRILELPPPDDHRRQLQRIPFAAMSAHA